MDFFDKGFSCVDLIDPKFALEVWNDVDKAEIHRLLQEVSEKPWKILTFPETLSFLNFVNEIDKVSTKSGPYFP